MNIRALIIDWIFQDTFIIHRLFLNIPLASKLQPIIKFLVELVMLISTAFILMQLGFKYLSLFLISFCIAHTLNWFIFGHLFHWISSILSTDIEVKIKALKYITHKLQEQQIPSILYGSFARGDINEYSDIDIFILGNNLPIKEKLKIIIKWLSIERLSIFFKYKTPVDIDIIENYDYLIQRCYKLNKYEILIPLCRATNISIENLASKLRHTKCKIIGNINILYS